MAQPVRASDLLIFAAASLKNALDELASLYEQKEGGEVAISYGGSSLLARQILAGAPADIYVSANPQWMDEVDQAGMLLANTRHDLVANNLVLVAAPGLDGAVEDLDDLLGILGDGRMAVGLLNAVPAGIYAKQALEHLGWLALLRPRLAQVDNVRNVLALVGRGEAKMGVVYESDLLASPDVRVLKRFSSSSHDPIIYPAALVAGARPEARLFLDLLKSQTGREILARHGFVPMGQP
jgi:molybdenum ABC transporter, periplasmic molybdate-binding protein